VWWNRASSGSPSFVAAMQSTDRRHRHDGTRFRRLNRSWLPCGYRASVERQLAPFMEIRIVRGCRETPLWSLTD
jgi:hypothetical protein